jgi:putative membrane protein insertion efficiency factor
MSDTAPTVILSAAKDPSITANRTRGFFAALRMTNGPARVASGLIWLYQQTVSPVLSAAAPSCGCRFAPTCSHYAREALQQHGFVAGAALAVRRIIKCGPWHPGGLDPVPASLKPRRASPRAASPYSCVSVQRGA